MSKTMSLILAGAAAVALTAPATAQPYGSSTPMATLYELPNFQGRSITIRGENANLSGSGFNDRARSGRFDGEWTLCEDANYRSRCETVRGQVRDLASVGMDGRASSARARDWNPNPYPGQGYPPGGGYPGGGYPGPGGGPWGGNRGDEGVNVVFYAHPRVGQVDLWGTGKMAADDFCRRMGHRYAVYFDVTQRSGRAQDFNGRSYNNANVLRDVLCHK